MTKTYQIALLPGDGIGPEVLQAGVDCLKALKGDFTFEFTTFDWSSTNYKQRGYYMPADGIEQLRRHDAIYFGAVGHQEVPDHISLWGLILPIRKELQQWVNVRPVQILPGTQSPLRGVDKIDWVIIRENSEGEYAGQGGRSHVGTAYEVGTELAIFTRVAIERVMRFAFDTARARDKRLCMVTKSNAQRYGMVLWDEVANAVAKEYPDVKMEKMLVDAMTVRMVNNPDSLSTIVATNLHADILSDLAAALGGSIGIAPSSNLNPERNFPSMFEPIHGSAFDLVGKGVANPIGAIWSAVEMLNFLGETTAGDVLMRAMVKVSADGVRTRDLGGQAGTKDVVDAIVKELGQLQSKL
ncbi:tartrate dehydrogenase [Gloeophyllum trabeum ATCC 11539]|uniref:D-malate dehydrogenase (decarboxylating) n=1 Tax=Gloeophyllum trabeum (strain ATCC 11539 / FP-39264 / Madison 617) TaxID=670483 RepID=S7Q8Q5_GLOTA|nr:tartrate dehydrogenase [Gloeophyllum trabeum ATCC 11539]EPQ55808.1 tartrate dehydrogenase [Gloeophyllum trabeum ATCC 11539]